MTERTALPTRNRKRDLSLKLTVVARRMRMRFDDSVQRSGAPRAHWPLIAVVARIPGATQKSIAQALKITEVSAGRLIDRLCQDGLLERTAKCGDRRAYCVSLTDRAEPLLDKIDAIAAHHETQAFEGLSEEQLQSLEHILAIIERNIGTDTNDSLGADPAPPSPQPRQAGCRPSAILHPGGAQDMHGE